MWKLVPLLWHRLGRNEALNLFTSSHTLSSLARGKVMRPKDGPIAVVHVVITVKGGKTSRRSLVVVSEADMDSKGLERLFDHKAACSAFELRSLSSVWGQ